MKKSKRKPGRPPGPTKKEKKKQYSIRAYPSDVKALKRLDQSLQRAVDNGVDLLLSR